MSDGIKFSDNGFHDFLQNAKPSQLKSALKAGLRKSLNIIRKQARTNLRAVTPAYNKKDKWGLTLQGGIIVKVKKDGLGGRAEIISRSKNANFKLKFFENGTAERFVKTKNGKRASRGAMKATPFFTPAVQSTKGAVHSSLQENLDVSLKKAFDKYTKK